MGGRLRFLGHACSSYTFTGSVLDAMDYGLAEAIWVVANQLLGLYLHYVVKTMKIIFAKIQSNRIHMHLIIFIVYIIVFTPLRVLTTLSRNYR